jgi:hypothetical protein
MTLVTKVVAGSNRITMYLIHSLPITTILPRYCDSGHFGFRSRANEPYSMAPMNGAVFMHAGIVYRAEPLCWKCFWVVLL